MSTNALVSYPLPWFTVSTVIVEATDAPSKSRE